MTANDGESTANGGEWRRMTANRTNSEVKRVIRVTVKLRIGNRLDMKEFDNTFVGKTTRMRLQPILERFFAEMYANHYEPVDFKVVIESLYD